MLFSLLIVILILVFDIIIEIFEVSLLSIHETDIINKYGHKSYVMFLYKKKKELLIAILIYEIVIQYIFPLALYNLARQYDIYIGTSITIFFTIIHIFFSILTKLFGLTYYKSFAYYLSPLFYYLMIFLRPMSIIFILINDKISKILDLQAEEIVNYKFSILSAITSSPHKNREIQIIKNALSIDDTTIDKIMTSRVDFVFTEFIEDIDEMKCNLMNLQHKHVIIMRDEDIIGTINKYIFFQKILSNEVSNILYEIYPPIIFSSTTKVSKLLEYFSSTKQSIIFVEDEEDIIGLVTLTDIIGDIVGQIETEEYFIQQTDNGIIIEGAYMIRQLNQKMNWNLPEQFRTLNGLILSIAYKIPTINSLYEYIYENQKYIFTILSTDNNIVTRLYITLIETEDKND